MLPARTGKNSKTKPNSIIDPNIQPEATPSGFFGLNIYLHIYIINIYCNIYYRGCTFVQYYKKKYMNKALTFLTAVLLIILVGNPLHAYVNNPQNGRPGTLGESTCLGCHSSFGLDSGPGEVEISDVPEMVLPEKTYAMTVIVNHTGQDRWGFELSSRDDGLGQGGILTATQAQFTSIGNSGGISYLKQRSAGSFSRQPNGASWDFEWTAPEAGSGPITFYVAGNSANGNNSTSRDCFYTSAVMSKEGSECTVDGEANFDGSIDVLVVVSLVGNILG